MQWLPLLQIQRDLLVIPRGGERFRRYLDSMLDDAGDLRLPLASFNPMSKDHVAALLDGWLALDAEHIGRTAMEEAAKRLPDLGKSSSTQVGLVVADDAKGGWTNRWLYEAKHQFENRYEHTRGIITALLWSSEPADAVVLRQKVMAAIYRHAWIQKHGQATTLKDMLRQEGMAARFAGVQMAPLHAEHQTLLCSHLETTHYPAMIACLYGDDAATECGYEPLGLPAYAGLRYGLVLAEARSIQ